MFDNVISLFRKKEKNTIKCDSRNGVVEAKVLCDFDIGITLQTMDDKYLFCLRNPKRHKQIFGEDSNQGMDMYIKYFNLVNKRISAGYFRRKDINKMREMAGIKKYEQMKGASKKTCAFY